MQETNLEKPSQTKRLLMWLLSGRHINCTQAPKILGISNNALPRRAMDLLAKRIPLVRTKETVESAMNGIIPVTAYYIPTDTLAEARKISGYTETEINNNCIDSVSNLGFLFDSDYKVTPEWVQLTDGIMKDYRTDPMRLCRPLIPRRLIKAKIADKC